MNQPQWVGIPRAASEAKPVRVGTSWPPPTERAALHRLLCRYALSPGRCHPKRRPWSTGSARGRADWRENSPVGVDKAVEKAAKKVSKAVDKGDYDAVVKAVNEGDEKIIEAAAS